MNPTVKAAFHAFSEPLEGRVHHLYLDVKKLPTTGVGNLVATLPEVRALPWRRHDGSLASPDEVAAMYAVVKSREDLAPRGGMAFAALTSLRLTDADVDALVERKLDANHMLLLRRFPELDVWPSDAQLFIHSWAWAVGPASPYAMMSAALRRQDFDVAATQCTINPQIGTIVERNRRNRLLLSNAARVLGFHFDPSPVYWPRDLAAEVKDMPTLPEVANPVSEDDGGASRHAATLDTVAELAREDLDDK